MEYVNLGNSGLKVSKISFGNWITGNKKENEEKIFKCIDKCFDLGINFFDTAQMYGSGIGEEILGNALKIISMKRNIKRSDYVVSTKIFKCLPNTINGIGLSRKNLIEGINASLKRLGLDYVDILYCHRYDSETPLEEVCRTMNDLINSEKILYWGTSEWTAGQITKAHLICEKYKLVKPICEQPCYNMFFREKVESDYLELFDEFKLGIVGYQPLAGGVLSGKYNTGEIPENTRVSDPVGANNRVVKVILFENKEENLKKLNEIEKISKELGCTMAQFSIAWCLKNGDVNSVVLGASKPEQLEENVKCLEIVGQITKEIEERLEKILKNQPIGSMNWRLWKPNEPRRKQNK